jgi:hypothetical protein
VPSGYEPTREPLLKFLRYVIDRTKKDVPRADSWASAA